MYYSIDNRTTHLPPENIGDKSTVWAEPFWNDGWTFQIDDTYEGLVKYHMIGEGNYVKNMTIGYPNTHEILIEINAASDGQLALRFPNNYVTDYPYYDEVQQYASVFVDEFTSNPITRTEFCNEIYEIPFEQGAEEIVIVGSALPALLTPSGKGHQVNASILVTGSQRIDLPIVTNSDSCYLDFDRNEKFLEISLSRPLIGEGYFQITIPKAFMSGNFTVLVDGQNIDFNSTETARYGNSTIIEFSYPYGAETATILATNVIPEFSSAMIAAILAAMITIVFLGSRITSRKP